MIDEAKRLAAQKESVRGSALIVSPMPCCDSKPFAQIK
jgi:hypothetical protein